MEFSGVQVMCSRCNTRWEVNMPTDAVSVDVGPASGSCTKCSQQWSLQMRPLLVHAYNNALAHFKPESCRLLDLLPSLYAAQCGSCTTIASFRFSHPPLPYPALQARQQVCHLSRIRRTVDCMSAFGWGGGVGGGVGPGGGGRRDCNRESRLCR
jgi:hypothetical protein